MNILSLFDGMSCGRLALDRLGIKVDKYYASEIDKYAIEVSSANYPDIIQIGDVCDVKGEDYPDIDLVMAGSPCQGFSFAGNQLAFDDPRSALFFEFVRILKEVKPKYFLLENVKMKKEFLDVISEHVGVEPILINSALVSAQNRLRYYWTNIPGVEQPEDRGIVLRDILETEPDEKYDISEAKVDRVLNAKRGKGFFYNEDSEKIGTVIAGYHKEPTDGSYIEQHKPVKHTERNRRHLKMPDEKSLCMTATMYKGAGNNGMTLVPMQVRALTEQRTEESKRIRKEHRQRTGKDWSPRGGKEMVPREDGKMNTLTTSLTKSHILEIKGGALRGRQVSDDDSWTQQLETRDDDKSNALTTVQKDSVVVDNVDDLHWRKLTPLECERLQTVPDNYTNHVSNTQRYKMLGNGWTIEVIAHILKGIS
jgi:DNA-cytosine methyltransferase